MVLNTTMERDERFTSNDSVLNIDTPTDDAGRNPDRWTISTILSLSNDFAIQKEKELSNNEQNGVVKVESLPYDKKRYVSTDSNDGSVDCNNDDDKEKWYSITIQVFIPFMIAGIGTIGAGIVLGEVEQYDVFKEVKALFILVPAILGLKGNLDMCLASRLSTQANCGNITSKRELFKMIYGNIGLVQVQAIVAACLVSIFAVSISAIMNGEFDWNDAMLLTTASVLTATLSCFILDFVLIAVIFLTHRFKLNPDNLATPLAASIGDVVSLIVLSTWASLLHSIHDTHSWVLFTVLGVYLLLLLPLWILIVRKNKYTCKILLHGWTPVLSALIISGLGGIVLDSAVESYKGFVVFQPIINGIGGNLVSVQSSRISTMLHKTSLLGILPPHTKQWIAPWTALFGGVISAQTARILILMSLPGQTIFVFIADVMYNHGICTVQPPFIFTYLFVGLLQIMILLYIAHILTHTMWRFKIDPDNSAIPYLTALGDLLGSSLLFLGFIFLKFINQEYSPVVTDDP